MLMFSIIALIAVVVFGVLIAFVHAQGHDQHH